MFSRIAAIVRPNSIRLLSVAGVLVCLICLLLISFRKEPTNQLSLPVQPNAFRNEPSKKIEADAAHNNLARSAEGESLMRTLEVARFRLKRHEKSPFNDDPGSGYLGLSHDENLNAWFDTDGVTIRPTVSKQDRAKSWRMKMRLEAYGNGTVLQKARQQNVPVVNRRFTCTRVN